MTSKLFTKTSKTKGTMKGRIPLVRGQFPAKQEHDNKNTFGFVYYIRSQSTVHSVTMCQSYYLLPAPSPNNSITSLTLSPLPLSLSPLSPSNTHTHSNIE